MTDRNYSDDAATNDGRVIVWGLQDIKESLDALVEQQRIANLIALGNTEHGPYRYLDAGRTDLTSMDALGSAAVLLGIKLKEESK